MFGMTSSPFLLQKTLSFHLQNYLDPLASTLNSCFYVDNFMRTYASHQQLESEYPRVNAILEDACMPLQGWVSNSQEFNQCRSNFDVNILDVNVLGVHWDTTSDVIQMYASEAVSKSACLDISSKVTKRQVVSVISSVFYPLGLVSPVAIKGKLFIQNLFKAKLSWDENLPEPLVVEFTTLCKSLSQVHVVSFPRYVISPGQSDLHLFCDSSKNAYGIAVYVVKSGSSNLLLSKSRVAPNPPLTIPKQELLALTLAARLANSLLENERLAFTNCTIWCDSEVAIQWVHGNGCSEVFVRNRVSEIDRIRKRRVIDILYVPSKQNPSDLLTRGVAVAKLNDPLWKSGPSFLLDPSEYPAQKHKSNLNVFISEVLVEPAVRQSPSVIDVSKYSTLTKAVRIMQRVIQFCKIYIPDQFNVNPLIVCIRLAQRESFPTLYQYLQQPEQRNQVPIEIKNLANQLDLQINEQGLIYCGSRLQHSDLTPDAQFPVYLPAKHHLTRLIIHHFHVIHHHCGVNALLMHLRQQFWISKGRLVIKRILKSCVQCRKVIGRSCSNPGPPPLPVERVKYVRPFNCIGVDFTGSITVHNPSETDDVAYKTYICLFTCTTSRAVHLESCNSLTTEDFLLAFRRFAARFGIPSVVISDNGSNFHGAERFLGEIQDEPEVRSYLQDHAIRWRFNTPRAPWSGGFFERLIGIVKTSLQKAIHKKRITFEELRTLLCEIESIVNARPLTYLSDDVKEDYLTPSHLLYGRAVTLFPPLNSFSDEPYGELLNVRLQYTRLSDMLKKFEKLWLNSYLTSLKERHSTLAKDHDCPVRKGDIVLIELENQKRSSYPLGIVIELIPGEDQIVRSAIIRAGGTEYARPLSKLIPLELHHESISAPQPIENHDPPQLPNAPPRPKRHAAHKAAQLRGELLREGLL